MKKIYMVLIVFITVILSACKTESFENINLDNVYGFDVYDVMEIGDIATIEVEISRKVPNTSGGWGYEVDAEDNFGVRSSIKGEEIMGYEGLQVFYSIPSSVGNDLEIGESYYIKVQKQLYPPNRRPQIGLVGSENISSGDYEDSKKRDESFNYTGSYCKITEIEKCTKMVNSSFSIEDSKTTIDDLDISEKSIFKAFNLFVEITNIEEVLIDGEYRKKLEVKDETGTAVLNAININHDLHNKLIEELELNKKYRLKIFFLEEGKTEENIKFLNYFLMQVEERLN